MRSRPRATASASRRRPGREASRASRWPTRSASCSTRRASCAPSCSPPTTGIEVTNNSYYVDPWMDKPCMDDPDQRAIVDAVNRAQLYAQKKGTLSFASAGNSNHDLDPTRSSTTPARTTRPRWSAPSTRTFCFDVPTQLPGRRHGQLDRCHQVQGVLLQLRATALSTSRRRAATSCRSRPTPRRRTAASCRPCRAASTAGCRARRWRRRTPPVSPRPQVDAPEGHAGPSCRR